MLDVIHHALAMLPKLAPTSIAISNPSPSHSGTLIGPVLGATVFESLKELLGDLTGRWHGILGVIFIVFVILIPDGLAGLATYPVKANQQREGKGRFTATAAEDYCWMWTARGPAKVTGKLGAEE